MALQSRSDNTTAPFLLPPNLGQAIDDQTFSQVSAATAGNITDTTSYPVADQDTLAFGVTVDGGTVQPVLFDITVTTALLVAQQLNDQLAGCSAGVVGGQVVITSDTVGVSSSIAITAGTSALTWAAAVAGTGGEGIADKTLVSQDPTTEEWVALTDVTATDGTEKPGGIYMGQGITAAELEAADVTGQVVLVNNQTFDESQLVMQGSVALDSVITSIDKTVRMALIAIGLSPQAVTDVSGFENQ